ncbi:hypothetical protein [Ferrimonas marina]|uniref:Uncharacterized protein n=1 Tax=Ferrimonas marina TaxID=299255 RepID=A0A1M5U2M8_9GAMM|nr:hypothetical protein [Ferrimonas marina]SHH57287.1 hypothetical protein SAMN02745129_2383 [Ferrimonas marina]
MTEPTEHTPLTIAHAKALITRKVDSFWRNRMPTQLTYTPDFEMYLRKLDMTSAVTIARVEMAQHLQQHGLFHHLVATLAHTAPERYNSLRLELIHNENLAKSLLAKPEIWHSYRDDLAPCLSADLAKLRAVYPTP